MKASEEQASMRKAVGKIGVDGKMEEGGGGETPAGYQFVGTPSMLSPYTHLTLPTKA